MFAKDKKTPQVNYSVPRDCSWNDRMQRVTAVAQDANSNATAGDDDDVIFAAVCSPTNLCGSASNYVYAGLLAADVILDSGANVSMVKNGFWLDNIRKAQASHHQRCGL